MADDKLEFDCKERVALDMARSIWANEKGISEKTHENYRKEFIKLYSQCYKAVTGFTYDCIFED